MEPSTIKELALSLGIDPNNLCLVPPHKSDLLLSQQQIDLQKIGRSVDDSEYQVMFSTDLLSVND